MVAPEPSFKDSGRVPAHAVENNITGIERHCLRAPLGFPNFLDSASRRVCSASEVIATQWPDLKPSFCSKLRRTPIVRVMLRNLCAVSHFFSPGCRNCITDRRCEIREMKNDLASWRLSADTGANAREKQGDRRTNP
jgi:hypothetical protein